MRESPKRAQMEMIGLVIIVILLTVGMLFLAIFALNQSEEKKVFDRKSLAYSTVNALILTTINDSSCREEAQVYPTLGEDLISDCATHYDVAVSDYYCSQEHSCFFLNETIHQLLNATLGQWEWRYELKMELIRLDAAPVPLLFLTNKKGCPEGIDRDGVEDYYIHTDAGNVRISFHLCS